MCDSRSDLISGVSRLLTMSSSRGSRVLGHLGHLGLRLGVLRGVCHPQLTAVISDCCVGGWTKTEPQLSDKFRTEVGHWS